MLKPSEPMTITEKKVFQFIRLYAQKFEYQPSTKEIAKYFTYGTQYTSEILNKIQKKGWMKIIGVRARKLFDTERR